MKVLRQTLSLLDESSSSIEEIPNVMTFIRPSLADLPFVDEEIRRAEEETQDEPSKQKRFCAKTMFIIASLWHLTRMN